MHILPLIYIALNYYDLFEPQPFQPIPLYLFKTCFFYFFTLSTLKCKGFEGNNKLNIGLITRVESNIFNPTSFKYNGANILFETPANGSSISPAINLNNSTNSFSIRLQQAANIDANGMTGWINILTNGTHKHTVATSNNSGSIINSFTPKIRLSEMEKPKVLNILYQHITPLEEISKKGKNIFSIDLPSLSFGSYFINIRNKTF